MRGEWCRPTGPPTDGTDGRASAGQVIGAQASTDSGTTTPSVIQQPVSASFERMNS